MGQNISARYQDIFGSLDICQCEQCRSVFSPAAYYVDLLHFLDHFCNNQADRERLPADYKNGAGETPLQVLLKRRPDLEQLELSCENTNTVIPYVDIVNEMLEYYIVNKALDKNAANNTKDETAEELRAEPQHTTAQAYKILADVVYPCSLPYHQPLDVTRTFLEKLKTSRFDILDIFKTDGTEKTLRSLDAELLELSETEYAILTGELFNTGAFAKETFELYGYTNNTPGDPGNSNTPVDWNELIIRVPELLRRTRINYGDLFEIVKTKFINPSQEVLEYIESIFDNNNPQYTDIRGSLILRTPSEVYNVLKSIADGSAVPDEDISKRLKNLNSDNEFFTKKIKDDFIKFRDLVTLFNAHPGCDTGNISLRSIAWLYEGQTAKTGEDVLKRMNRFIRLWKKIGWTVHETDAAISAVKETGITTGLIRKIATIKRLKEQLGLPVLNLLCLWGDIDLYSGNSLYKKLFLRKSLLNIDPVFQPDIYGNFLTASPDKTKANEPLNNHAQAIIAALNLRAEDFSLILLDQGIDASSNGSLNLVNLSVIYRHVLLAKAAGIKVKELCTLKSLSGIDPFLSPSDTFRFLDISGKIKNSGFNIATIDFICRGTNDPQDKSIPVDTVIFSAVKSMRNGLLQVEKDHPFPQPGETITEDLLRSKFSLVFSNESIISVFDLLNDNLSCIVADAVNLVNLPVLIRPSVPLTPTEQESWARINERFQYLKGKGSVQYRGNMTDDERRILKAIDQATPAFQVAIDDLFNQAEEKALQLTDNIFSGYLSIRDSTDIFLAGRAPHPVLPVSEQYKKLYLVILPFIKKQLGRNLVIESLSILLGTAAPKISAVFDFNKIDEITNDLLVKGLNGGYYNNATFSGPVALVRVDELIDFDWKTGLPGPGIRSNQFSVQWSGYISPLIDGQYTFLAQVSEKDEGVQLIINEQQIIGRAPGDLITDTVLEASEAIDMKAGQLYTARLNYSETSGNAGIHLYWKNAAGLKELINSENYYPGSIIETFKSFVRTAAKACRFIEGFSLSEREIKLFSDHQPDFENIDFVNFRFAQWLRINDYVVLKKQLSPGTLVPLTDLFEMAGKAYTESQLSSLLLRLLNISQLDLKALNVSEKELLASMVGRLSLQQAKNFLTDNKAFKVDTILLALATGWDIVLLHQLMEKFNAGYKNFINEIGLLEWKEIINVSKKTGIEITKLFSWAESSQGNYADLYAVANDIKQTVKSYYDDDTWAAVAKPLSDSIREHQKQALVAHLMVIFRYDDAGQLYEHFLIDVQMDACMDTSRIVQAISSVQLFVQRCLLNLESIEESNTQVGVTPGLIEVKKWEWMKKYRVSEANRRVFVYPENLLEPQWRNTKSPFFADLESELLQDEITNEKAEQALRNYLSKLEEVAKLEVCGLFQEDDGTLHVVGRVLKQTNAFYYRKRTPFNRWLAWEKVDAGIEAVNDGENSGSHLMPVVWKGKLLLVWPIFQKKYKNKDDQGGKNFSSMFNDEKIQDNLPISYWDVQLAYTEKKDNKWSPKQIFPETITPGYFPRPLLTPVGFVADTSGIQYISDDHPSQFKIQFYNLQTLTFDMRYKDAVVTGGSAHIESLYSKLNIEYNSSPGPAQPFIRHIPMALGSASEDSFFFNGIKFGSNLFLLGNTYLSDPPKGGSICFPAQSDDFIHNVDRPFFYNDQLRCYFVLPGNFTYTITKLVEKPEQVELNAWLLSKPEELMVRPGFNAQQPTPSKFIGPLTGGAEIVSKNHFINNQVLNRPVAPNLALRSNDVNSLNRTGGQSAGYNDLKKYAILNTNAAFSNTVRYETVSQDINGRQLSFENFFHPYVGSLVDVLNKDGIRGLFSLSVQSTIDSPNIFDTQYNPHNLLNPGVPFVKPPYPVEKIDCDPGGAYSLYNWELFFFVPMLIGTHLSKNGKYKEAMDWFHRIFDPTSNEAPDPAAPYRRFWQFLPFREIKPETIDEYFTEINKGLHNPEVNEWRENMFDPHTIAFGRPVAYMKHTVMRYIDNLVAWGDSLFVLDTMESINEATLYYVMAGHLLGEPPQHLPRQGKIAPETYSSLQSKLDAFSNAAEDWEYEFPLSGPVTISPAPVDGNLLGGFANLYFCIPANDKMLQYWDTVEDRLNNIRHCRNIEGITRSLALFEPPIDPAALVSALSQGLSIGDALGDLNAPLPFYRFTFMVQKAIEMCNDIRGIGNNLLSVMEKHDAEELAAIRATHEKELLKLIKTVKELQAQEAEEQKKSILKTRDVTAKRLEYYESLLGTEKKADIPEPDFDHPDQLILIDDLPFEINLDTVDGSDFKILAGEKEELHKMEIVLGLNTTTGTLETIAGIANLFPVIDNKIAPFGIGAGTSFGGPQFGAALSAVARATQAASNYISAEAQRASKLAGYTLRAFEWTQQRNLAAREINQVNRQLIAADIRTRVTRNELKNHEEQIKQSERVETFLLTKFTNKELYEWMKSQLYDVYKQSYHLAYDLAKKAEKCYCFERGEIAGSFIRNGYWEGGKQGLLAGDRLHFAIKQMERAYTDANKREYEITKHLSLLIHDPQALINLKTTSSCEFELPEELFDLDHRGHTMRRIKSVSLSIPCVVGPYASVSCKLSLLKNEIRINNRLLNGTQYGKDTENDDPRFYTDFASSQSIATSNAQNDNGLFELNFRDERYLPFEGAGVISRWRISLPDQLKQFDYDTIADVILQIRYTAREGGEELASKATTHLNDFYKASFETGKTQGVNQLFNLRYEFANEWHSFFKATEPEKQILELKNFEQRLPLFVKLYGTEKTELVSLKFLIKGDPVKPALNSDKDDIRPAQDIGDIQQFIMTDGLPLFTDSWKIQLAGNGLIKKENLDNVLLLVNYKLK
ncbi:MAG: neuraminidase-like domain-containing protein [Ferruginibacter sp.]